jgi:hypothetical protein
MLTDLLCRPHVAMTDLARRGRAREGLGPMLVLGALHAAFSLLLWRAGHAPRVGIPGLGRESHYLFQAAFAVPLYGFLFWLGGSVAHGLARLLGGKGSRDATLAVFGVAYAAPMIALFIVPDVVVYLALGFGAIGKAMRFYAPVAALGCLLLGAWGLAEVHGIGRLRAAGVALGAFLVQAAVGGVVLR